MLIKMPPFHAKQYEIAVHPARFKVVSCGRRFGKTLLAVALIFGCAAEGGAAWWVGPTSREAGIGWKQLREMAGQVPGVTIRDANKEIRFPGGGWLAVLSAESQTLRGEGLDLVVIDEAAFVKELRRVWTADLRAALSDRMGNAIFITSPDGRTYLYDLFQRGQDPAFPDWMNWQATSYDNPFLDKAEIDAARAELPDWVFRQEYLAEFIGFAGKVYKQFDPTTRTVFHDLDTSIYRDYYGGIDFGFRNPSVLAVGGLDKDDRLDIVDGTYAREMTTPDLIDAIRDHESKYNIRRWSADPAEPGIIKELRNAGIQVYGAPRIKGELERSYVKSGIVRLETRMVQDRFRICADTCPSDFIREFDLYRYADEKEGREEKEMPVKVDDHAPDAVRYMNDMIVKQRGGVPRLRVAA